jgi:UDP-N-acetylmuramoyl-L-alanyl-D-glutamate--2,6-diaminopimelate ligase
LNERRLDIRTLAARIPGSMLHGPEGGTISGITYDSRQVHPGDLFAALRGGDHDGHTFVADAARRGAAALLVESPVASPLPQIVTDNSRAALAIAAAAFFGSPSESIGVIGVTGTDGKTTTAHLVDHVLRAHGVRTGLVGTVAIRIGDVEDHHESRQTTPESNDIQRYLRAMVSAGAAWAVLEATSHGLAMHRLDEVRFRIGAVTNVTHEHLDFHGTREAYLRAKAILFERVAFNRGTVVLNIDDPGAREMAPYANGARIVTYSPSGQDAELRATEVRCGAAGCSFVVATQEWGEAPVRLGLVGEFNVANALCAVGIGLAAGFGLDEIAGALGSASAIPGRMAAVDMGQPFRVIIDYAHTPEAMGKVIRLLRKLHPVGRVIAVFGSAGERDVQKRPVQGRIAAELADIAIVTSEDPRLEDAEAIIAEIAAGALSAGAKPGTTLFCITDRREAIAHAIGLAMAGDCVLLAGKGHETSIIWGRQKMPWNEEAVAREELAAAGYGDSRR